MLKRLAILTMFLAIGQAGAPMPRVAANAKGGGIAEKDSKSEAQAQPSGTIASSSEKSSAEASKKTEDPKPGKDGWDKAAVLSNYLLVGVGIVGIIYAALTFGKLTKQTKAAEDAAKAALLNAQAVIHAERALLLFTVEKESVSRMFHIYVVNHGKTPARRLEISKPLHVMMTLDAFVSLSPPDYGDDLEGIQEWLAPNEKWRVATFFPYNRSADRIRAARNQGVAPDSIEVIIYGQVTYMDGISSTVRHSRYCLAHDREPFSNIGGSLTPVGNEEYLECT